MQEEPSKSTFLEPVLGVALGWVVGVLVHFAGGSGWLVILSGGAAAGLAIDDDWASAAITGGATGFLLFGLADLFMILVLPAKMRPALLPSLFFEQGEVGWSNNDLDLFLYTYLGAVVGLLVNMLSGALRKKW